jgi:DNA-binding MarR family transcriptional regulator
MTFFVGAACSRDRKHHPGFVGAACSRDRKHHPGFVGAACSRDREQSRDGRSLLQGGPYRRNEVQRKNASQSLLRGVMTDLPTTTEPGTRHKSTPSRDTALKMRRSGRERNDNNRERAMAAKEDVLIAIRKIIRATDIHSRQLTKSVGLTAPQVLVMQAIRDLGAVAISRLSSEVSLSQATVTTIIDRLERRGYLARQRSEKDKRVVHALLTDSGRDALANAPTPLQQAFSIRFEKLEKWEQTQILSALQRVAAMMGADDLDASPFLDLGDLSRYDE